MLHQDRPALARQTLHGALTRGGLEAGTPQFLRISGRQELRIRRPAVGLPDLPDRAGCGAGNLFGAGRTKPGQGYVGRNFSGWPATLPAAPPLQSGPCR